MEMAKAETCLLSGGVYATVPLQRRLHEQGRHGGYQNNKIWAEERVKPRTFRYMSVGERTAQGHTDDYWTREPYRKPSWNS